VNKEQAITAAKKFPWAKWVAKDNDGAWHAYDRNPIWSGDEFVLPRTDGKYLWLGEERPPKSIKVKVPK
jgi:hypothetical protein